MKKLKLNLEDLTVESFEIKNDPEEFGTVKGFGKSFGVSGCLPECPSDWTCDATCPDTCEYTCDDPTCGGYTCYQTCDGGGYTCPPRFTCDAQQTNCA